MKKISKIIFFSTISLLSVGVLGTSIGFSMAKYETASVADQQVGYKGTAKKSIYLNANIWNVDDPLFYMYCYKSGGSDNEWKLSSKMIMPTIYGNESVFTLFVFEFDNIKYDYFNFVRVNPNGAHIGTWTRDDNPQTVWNSTANIAYSDSVNYYCIEKWDNIANGDGYGHATCGYTSQKLTLRTADPIQLQFTGTYDDSHLNAR